MSFAARPHATAAGAGAALPLGTFQLQAESFDEVGSTFTATATVNTNGTITGSGNFEYVNAIVPAKNWYTPTTTGIGSSYQVRFTLVSGPAWNAGLTSGVAYALTSARALSWSVAYNNDGYVMANVLVEILTTGGDVYASGTLQTSLWNGES